MSFRLSISRMGAQGDGIADTPDGPVFVPFTLPGETVNAARAGNRAESVAIVEASPERVEPACRHFGECGGCALQHWQADKYGAWKRSLVVQALAGRGIDVEVEDLVMCAPATRRRAVFSARRIEGAITVGFNQALSNRIIGITECPVLDPRIVSALPALRDLAEIVITANAAGHVTVTLTEAGLDIAFADSGKLSEAARKGVVRFAMHTGLARVSVGGEIIVEPVKPQILFDGAAVVPPPGAFLQAVAQAEQVMAERVLAHVGKAKRTADLFAGCGTFALRLARRTEVLAFESDAPSVAALDRGYRGTPGLKRVTAQRRDLFQLPLLPRELIGLDAIVFDPPRAGAEAQCRHLAKSDVPKVAAVSCNPVTLARDLEILLAGGYHVKSVLPVDQFLWSPHVEAVALLEKPKKRR